jgi:hypothetical protein
VIEESEFPWNIPLLVVPKKDDARGEKKLRLVPDFRKPNEKTDINAYPLPDVTEIRSIRAVEIFSLLRYGDGLPPNRAERSRTGKGPHQHKKWT